MNIEESEAKNTTDHTLDWLEDSVALLPLSDDPNDSSNINTYQRWDQTEAICQDLINNSTSLSSTTNTTTNTNTTSLVATNNPTITKHPMPPGSNKKCKDPDDPVPQTSQNHHRRKNPNCLTNKDEQHGEAVVEEVVAVKRSNENKKSSENGTGNNCDDVNNKEGRWAEQLLNPCAAAITKGDLSRVQQLLYVLHELSSPTGDANHRLAAQGHRALIHHLSTSTICSAFRGTITFASAQPKVFLRSLLKFYEVSPWFSLSSNIANASILQVLAQEQDHMCNLHILDIGVSHGVQWPTLLEALARRPEGPPPLVRITVITATIENDQNTETPFSMGPPGDNFSSRLLGFAKSMNINLQIKILDSQPFQNLNAQVIDTNPEETLIVCAQFRLRNLNHNTPDERTQFLRVLRSLEPKGVILSENDMDCSCNSCGDFATGFSWRVQYLWRFLDSTSSAFRGQESEERRVMEGEAAKALTNRREMNEGKEKWCERMRGVGFVSEVFGEDAIDGARALLRKYDSNWEMRIEGKDGCVGLWWKGQPISFCSLWKLDMNGNDS